MPQECEPHLNSGYDQGASLRRRRARGLIASPAARRRGSWRVLALILALYAIGCGGEAPPPDVPPPPPPTSSAASTSTATPQFPARIPPPSAHETIPSSVLVSGLSAHPTLGEVAERLASDLASAGYSDQTWYETRAGFAVVTRTERINDSGEPLDGNDRWLNEQSTPHFRTLGEYLLSLLNLSTDHYRAFALIVDTNLQFDGAPIDLDDAIRLGNAGSAAPPESMRDKPYTMNHHCFALVYEFQRAHSEASATLVKNSSLSAKEHLAKSGIAAAVGLQ